MTVYNYKYALKLLSRIENAAASARNQIAEQGKIDAYEWYKITNDITSDLRCAEICVEREFRQERSKTKMTDNKAKTTAADKVITREPIVIEKHSFDLPKSTGFILQHYAKETEK